jgi:hypothetical protein
MVGDDSYLVSFPRPDHDLTTHHCQVESGVLRNGKRRIGFLHRDGHYHRHRKHIQH